MIAHDAVSEKWLTLPLRTQYAVGIDLRSPAQAAPLYFGARCGDVDVRAYRRGA